MRVFQQLSKKFGRGKMAKTSMEAWAGDSPKLDAQDIVLLGKEMSSAPEQLSKKFGRGWMDKTCPDGELTHEALQPNVTIPKPVVCGAAPAASPEVCGEGVATVHVTSPGGELLTLRVAKSCRVIELKEKLHS